MVEIYWRWVLLAVISSSLFPVFVMLCTSAVQLQSNAVWLFPIALACSVYLSYFGTKRLLHSTKPLLAKLESESEAFVNFIGSSNARFVAPAIVLSATLGLFLELLIIRWQGTVFEFFSYYKNFSLMACFAGLGIGFALCKQNRLPLILVAPLIFWQLLFVIFLRFGVPYSWIRSMMILPFTEQTHMVYFDSASSAANYGAVFYFLSIMFLLTALPFIPIGQLCGKWMTLTSNLRAYGFNLLGSLSGIVLMFILSFGWTSPAVWFGLAFIMLLAFQTHKKQSLFATATFSLLSLVALSWPVQVGNLKIYSPYQIIELVPGERGWSNIAAAGQYYQRMLNLSPDLQNLYPDLKTKARYYDFPYKLKPHPDKVAIVGAGSGNDAAAALRNGAGSVTAIEIEPAIVELGRQRHPEQPYLDPRVKVIVNDARAFLRKDKDQYDLVVFGLLDSHTLSSHATGLRTDSYVYTVEAFKEARERLKPGGLLSLSFAAPHPEIGKKFYLMLKQAFNGVPPVVIATGYDEGAATYLQTKEADIKVPEELVASEKFLNIGPMLENPLIKSSISTDDWPFIYMSERVFPLSYLPMIGLVIGISFALNRSLSGIGVSKPYWSFFFLGAGFMLVETKAITELSLYFGNTWSVIGLVVFAIIFMAYLANLFVLKFKPNNIHFAFISILASIAAGLFFVAQRLEIPGALGSAAVVGILTMPLFFSGIAFSIALRKVSDISAAMSMNLIGAILGGMLEYLAMKTGYQMLYFIGIGVYICAWISAIRLKAS